MHYTVHITIIINIPPVSQPGATPRSYHYCVRLSWTKLIILLGISGTHSPFSEWRKHPLSFRSSSDCWLVTDHPSDCRLVFETCLWPRGWEPETRGALTWRDTWQQTRDVQTRGSCSVFTGIEFKYRGRCQAGWGKRSRRPPRTAQTGGSRWWCRTWSAAPTSENTISKDDLRDLSEHQTL